MFKGKTIILGVTGSIAAYKTASLASMLVKQGAEVHVLMTKNAMNFIHPITFETLTGNKCISDTFDRNFEFEVGHISLAKKASVLMIAPATANVIGKLSYGIADDMLTTTALACTCPILVSPAMNTRMYENPVVQDNLKRLEARGYRIIAPRVGYLACRDIGPGKMPEPEELFRWLERELAGPKDLKGKRLLVTAGPTQESIDPVRYITNHSSGKMGYAIAHAAMLRGADVTLVSGPVSIVPPAFVNVVRVTTAREMFDAVTQRQEEADIIIKAAAVADFRPESQATDKIKKKGAGLTLTLEATDDILKYLGEHKKPGQILCGFSMETKDLLVNSRKKLESKNLDMIAANNLKVEGAGFAGDTNVLTLITKDRDQSLPLMSKEEAAWRLLDALRELL
ncbi:MAG: bifunctional phosphopantothenoylcysteine decarboxylase/phosphopantothenate--cysteine ligase CoaBC [Blautia sp.]|nr:bifunctional phosphopantothenoylcysteine decarboxylase/phosphopantothenate--cysteine ligase CoaBC [Blautia sp.]